MDEMGELVKEFLLESYENLDRLDQDFVALEADPTSRDRLKSIFRTIHTIKGTCGCLGLSKLESVAHVGENLLSRLRDGEMTIDTEITTGLLRMVDAVREMLGLIESTGQEGDKDYSSVVSKLVELNSRSAGASAPAAPKAEAPAPVIAPPPAPAPAPVASAPIQTTPAPEAPKAEAHAPEEAEEHGSPAEEKAPKPVAVAQAAESANAAPAAEGGATGKDSVSGNSIRVDVTLLDKLMNLVGELVLSRNQVLQFSASQNDPTFLRTAQRLNMITSELQEGVMKTRMQPIGNVWNKFPRIVRDVANACGKKVRVEMEGRETELDKTILEAIKDPLTHVIRNSVDHGIETPDKRIAAGKPEEGRLFMRAFHEGGQVNIEISDDGKGINPDIIKRKALEKGLITPDQAARMSERDAILLIFLPGFSTAEKVTSVSGRGVGMDVVRTNVEKIGGTVDVKSKVGEGTVLLIKIPLTLAIIPALIVTSGGERFAIPQVSLLELVRVEENEEGIELINGTPLYRLRGNLLPLVYLNRELALESSSKTASGTTATNIVVLRGGDRQFGLVVDQINDTEEIVVKPLAKQLKGIPVFAGSTIMGDGKVALILDVMGLAQSANVLSHANEQNVVSTAGDGHTDGVDRQTLLLFQLHGEERMAIPLSTVARLEEFPRTALENAGGQLVVQYRGQIMPIVNVASLLGDRRSRARASRRLKTASESDRVQIVVYTHDKRNIGLRVEKIDDVVQERVDLQKAAARPGVLGTAIIKDKVTEFLDLQSVVREVISKETANAA